uniref:Uncharacterized protein n=1 Tax=Branchiostoma floridae TaxID=7739 RepID=C3YV72_BRAFL|eukprot:XP_002599776.1 hypothetical protein BRAFLDRAFT_70244 [Branchiostoma floridae]
MDPPVSKPPTWLLQAIKAVQKQGLATKDRIVNHVCRHHGVPRDTVQQQVESATNRGQILRVRQARGACVYINPTDATWSRAKVQLKRLKSKDFSDKSLRPRDVGSVGEENISLNMEVWDSPTKEDQVTGSSNSPEAYMAPASTDSDETETMTTREVKTESGPTDDFVISLILDAVDKIKFGRKKASREAIVDSACKTSGLQKDVIQKGFEVALASGVISSKNSGASYYCNPSDFQASSQTNPQTNLLFTTTPSTHADYFLLICKAILDMDEEGGSSLLAISRYLVHDLQVENSFSLKARLQQAAKRGLAQGKLQKDGILYKLGHAEKSNMKKCQLDDRLSGKPDMTVKQLIREVLRKMKLTNQHLCAHDSRDSDGRMTFMKGAMILEAVDGSSRQVSKNKHSTMDPPVSKPPTWLLQAIKAVQKQGLATKDRIVNHVCRHHGVPRDTVQQQVESATNQGQILRVRQAKGACVYINPTDATWSRAKVQLKRLKSKDFSDKSLRSRDVGSVGEENISLNMEVWDSPTKEDHVTGSSNSPEAYMAPASTDSDETETMTTREVKTESGPTDDFVISLILDAVDKIKFGRKKASREAIVDSACKTSGLQKDVIQKGFEVALASGVISSKNSGASYYCNPSDFQASSQTNPQTNLLFTTTPSTHADYFLLICKAILDMDEEGGSSLLAISRYLVHDLQVENNFSLKARLQQAAKRGLSQGKLQKDGILYKLGHAEKSNMKKCQLDVRMSGKPDMTVKQLIREVLRKMKVNKQKPSEEGICRPISRDCSIAEKDLLECLDLCVDEGSILQIYKADGSVVYKLPATDVIKPVKRRNIPDGEKEANSSGTDKKLRCSDSPSLEEMLHKAIKRKHMLRQQTTAVGIFSTLLRMTKKVFTLGQVRSQLALSVEKGSMTKMGYGGKTLYFSVTAAVQNQSSVDNKSAEGPLDVETMLHDGPSVAADSNPFPVDEAVPQQGSKKYRKWLIRAIHDIKAMRQRVTAERICKRVLRQHKVDPTVVQLQLALCVQDSRSTINRIIMPDGVAIYRVGKGTASKGTTSTKQTARKSVKQKGSSSCQKSSNKADPIIANYILHAILILKRLNIALTAEHICRQVYLNHDSLQQHENSTDDDAQATMGSGDDPQLEVTTTDVSQADVDMTDNHELSAVTIKKVTPSFSINDELRSTGSTDNIMTKVSKANKNSTHDPKVTTSNKEGLGSGREGSSEQVADNAVNDVPSKDGESNTESHVMQLSTDDSGQLSLDNGLDEKNNLLPCPDSTDTSHPVGKTLPKGKGSKLSSVSKPLKQKGGGKPVLTLEGTGKPDALVKKWILEAIQKCRELRVWTSEDQIIKRVRQRHGSHVDAALISDNLARCLREGSVEKKFLPDGRESYRLNKDVRSKTPVSSGPSPDPLVKATLLEAIHTNENTAATPYTDEICKKVANMLGQREQHIYEQLRLCMKEGSIAECEQSNPDPLVKATILDVIRSQDPRNRPYTEDICEEVAQLLGKDVDEIEMELQLCIKEGSIAEMEEEEYEEPPRPIVHVDPDSSVSELVVHAAQQMDDRHFTVRDVERWIGENFSLDVAAGVDLGAKIQEAYTQCYREGTLPATALNSSTVQGSVDVDSPRPVAFVDSLQQHENSTDDDAQATMGSGDDPQLEVTTTDVSQADVDMTDNHEISAVTIKKVTPSFAANDDLRSTGSTDNIMTKVSKANKNSTHNPKVTKSNKVGLGSGREGRSEQVADNAVDDVPSKDGESNTESHDMQLSTDDLLPSPDSTDTSHPGKWGRDDSQAAANLNGPQRSINKMIENLWQSKRSMNTGKGSGEDNPSDKDSKDVLQTNTDITDDFKSEDSQFSKDDKDVLQSDTDETSGFKSEDSQFSKDDKDVLQTDKDVLQSDTDETDDCKTEDPQFSKEDKVALQSDTDETSGFKSEDSQFSKDAKMSYSQTQMRLLASCLKTLSLARTAKMFYQSDTDETSGFKSEDSQFSKDSKNVHQSDTDETSGFMSEDPQFSKDSKNVHQSDTDITSGFKSEDSQFDKDDKDVLQTDTDTDETSGFKAKDSQFSKDSKDVLQTESDTDESSGFKSEDPQFRKSNSDITDDLKSAPDCCDDGMTSGPPLLSPQRRIPAQVPSPKPSPPLLIPQRVITTEQSPSPPEMDPSVCLPILSSGIKQER